MSEKKHLKDYLTEYKDFENTLATSLTSSIKSI